MVKQKLKTWKCSVCGKEMESQWENQLEQWKQQHLATHDKRRDTDENLREEVDLEKDIKP